MPRFEVCTFDVFGGCFLWWSEVVGAGGGGGEVGSKDVEFIGEGGGAGVFEREYVEEGAGAGEQDVEGSFLDVCIGWVNGGARVVEGGEEGVG